MTMVIRFGLRIRDQIGTSVSFGIKNENPPPPPYEMLALWRRLCTKWLHWQSCRLGGSYFFMRYDVFRQNADFLKEWSWSALTTCTCIKLLGTNKKCWQIWWNSLKSQCYTPLTLYDPGGPGGGFKRGPPNFALTHLILELHYCALRTSPKK